MRKPTTVEEVAFGSGSGASYNRSSNPAKDSMISDYFEFEDYTGEVTIEKTKVPRSQAVNPKLGAKVVHYSQEEQINTMKFGDFGGISETASPAQPTTVETTYTTYQSPVQNYSTDYSYSAATNSDNSKYSTDSLLEDIKKYSTPGYQPTTITSYDTTSYSTYGTGNTDTTYKSYDTYQTSYDTYTSPSYSSTYKPLETTNTYGSTLNDYQPAKVATTPNYSATTYTAPTPNYNYDSKYPATTSYTSSYTSNVSNDPYSAYSLGSIGQTNNYGTTYSSNYSSFTTPKDYNFYSSNPYVSSALPPAQTQTQTTTATTYEYKNPYLKENSSSTDYLSRYGVSSPPQSG